MQSFIKLTFLSVVLLIGEVAANDLEVLLKSQIEDVNALPSASMFPKAKTKLSIFKSVNSPKKIPNLIFASTQSFAQVDAR